MPPLAHSRTRSLTRSLARSLARAGIFYDDTVEVLEGGELVVYDDDLPEDEEDARHLEEQIGDMEDLRRA